MSEQLSPEGYAATGGLACPACGGTPLFPGDFTRRGLIAVTQHGRCAQCGSTWFAVYELSGYEGLRGPLDAP